MSGDRRLQERQPTMVYPQLGFPHRVWRYRPGDNCFRLRLIGVVDIRRVFCFEDGVVRILPGAGGFTNPSQSATSQLWGSGWGFHTVRGGIDTEDDRFSLRFVGVVYMEGYPI